MKKLYRTEENKIFAGVCGGIGEYFNIDANIIRIAFTLLGFTGTGIIAYIIAACIVPSKSHTF